MLAEYRTPPTDLTAEPSRRAPSRPNSPAEVREEVRHALAEARRSRLRIARGGDEIIGDALLVATELTTNAMLHGGGVTGFEVALDDEVVHLSVSDNSPEFPAPKRGDGERMRMGPGGHGWPIVCRLARDVTISELGNGGKRITAVVPLFTHP